jgi:hypothetical protein
MQDTPRWEELCREATLEQDPEKLMELVEEINRLLDEKHEWLVNGPPKEAFVGHVHPLNARHRSVPSGL